jgi:hypothetical protein
VGAGNKYIRSGHTAMCIMESRYLKAFRLVYYCSKVGYLLCTTLLQRKVFLVYLLAASIARHLCPRSQHYIPIALEVRVRRSSCNGLVGQRDKAIGVFSLQIACFLIAFLSYSHFPTTHTLKYHDRHQDAQPQRSAILHHHHDT